MKILLCVSSYLPNVGGREVVVHQLAKAYQELGHEVRVAGPGSWWKFRKINFGYPLHRLPQIPLIPNEWILIIQLLLIKFIYKFDIIHAHSTHPNGYAAAKIKNILKCPIIITPHGEDIHVVPEIGFGNRLDPELDKKIRYALNAADYATAISDSVVDSILDAGAPKEKIILIPNGVDLERFRREQNTDIFKMMDIPYDSQIVLSIGNYHPRKGHEVLIESIKHAVKKNSKIRLIIVGKLSDTLTAKVKTEGLDNYIKFTGKLKYPLVQISDEPDVVVALMHAAEVYVTASIGEGTEGLSLALLEAMSSGLCVIASDISGNRDVIENERTGIIVPPSSAEALTTAILDVLADEEKRKLLKLNAQEAVQQYGWIEVAKKYVSLYNSSLSNHS